jgi:hypothetical protein
MFAGYDMRWPSTWEVRHGCRFGYASAVPAGFMPAGLPIKFSLRKLVPPDSRLREPLN